MGEAAFELLGEKPCGENLALQQIGGSRFGSVDAGVRAVRVVRIDRPHQLQITQDRLVKTLNAPGSLFSQQRLTLLDVLFPRALGDRYPSRLVPLWLRSIGPDFQSLNGLNRGIGSARQALEGCRRPALQRYVPGLMEW